MPKEKVAAEPVTAISQTAARLSLAATATFVALLAALHAFKPGLDPSWRVISESAVGHHGWMMVLAFLSLGLGCVALFIAIRSQLRTIGGRIGLAFLLISAAGLVIAAIFTTDPITASGKDVTTHGSLHVLGAGLGTGIPIAAALISWQLARSPAWSSVRRSLIGVTLLAWIGFLVFSVSAATMPAQNDGKFGPDVLIGWPNRFMMLAYCGWLMTVASRALQLRGTEVTRFGEPDARATVRGQEESLHARKREGMSA